MRKDQDIKRLLEKGIKTSAIKGVFEENQDFEDKDAL